MLHLHFFVLLELVILNRVAERLVRSKLFFHHALDDAIVRELLLQLNKLLADLPLVGRLCQLIDTLLV